MKRLVYILLFAFGISSLCSSCQFEEDQMGFPKTVVFSKEGGTQVIGDVEHPFALTNILIGEGSDEVGSQIKDSMLEVSHKWLTAKAPKKKNLIYITADSLKEGSYRTLVIYAYSGTTYATIKVKQRYR